MEDLWILHLSDLHFGNKNRFADQNLKKLGKACHKALEHARQDMIKELALTHDTPRIKLVIVSGDLTETAKPAEFTQAQSFLEALAGELGIEHRRFVFVPGNHDVSWPLCKKVAADQDEEGFTEEELRKRLNAVKLQRYHEFLYTFYNVKSLHDITGCLSLGRDAWIHNPEAFPVSIAALNSCEQESHRKSDHVGLVSDEQAQALMNLWQKTEYDQRLKILVVHHNPVATTPNNIQAMVEYHKQHGIDPELLERYNADVVGFPGRELLRRVVKDTKAHLILHGHHHDQGEPELWPWSADGHAPVLSTGSWGLQNTSLPGDAPPSCQLLFFGLHHQPPRLEARQLVYDSRFRLQGEVLEGQFRLDAHGRGRYSHSLPFQLPVPPKPKTIQRRSPRSKKAGGSEGPSEELPEGPSKELSPDQQSFLRTYRQRMAGLFGNWDLKPVGVAQTGDFRRPLDADLESMYLPLRLGPGYNPNETDQGVVIDADSLLNRCQNPTTRKKNNPQHGPPPMIIRGAAGTGKTTWMRHTFRQLLRREDVLPIMVVLRDIAKHWNDPQCKGAQRSLDYFLDMCVAEHLGQGWDGTLSSLFQKKQAPQPVLLVDGWDELGPLGIEFREKLLGFRRQFPHVLVVVSSRPYGSGKPQHSDGFEELDIQPLSDQEITHFTKNFFALCYAGDPKEIQQEAQLFGEALRRSPQAAVLAKTTLFLTMMLMISRSDRLPDKRHLLYEKCINNLLTALPQHKQDTGALNLPEHYCPPDSEERKRLLAKLAHFLHTQQDTTKSHTRSGLDTFATWSAMAAQLPPSPTWTEAQRIGFLSWLAGPAGLLTDRTDGTLAFSHLSFQEYLAAWYLHVTVAEHHRGITFTQWMDIPV